jgi:hypothetical protein
MSNTTQAPSLLDDGDFLLELDKIGTVPTRVEPERPGFWAPHPQAGRGHGPATTSRTIREDSRNAPDGQSAHEDDDEVPAGAFEPSEVVPAAAAYAATGAAETDADPQRVPNYLAALVILLCMGVGASGAALAFHNRVQRIVAAWTLAAR